MLPVRRPSVSLEEEEEEEFVSLSIDPKYSATSCISPALILVPHHAPSLESSVWMLQSQLSLNQFLNPEFTVTTVFCKRRMPPLNNSQFPNRVIAATFKPNLTTDTQITQSTHES